MTLGTKTSRKHSPADLFECFIIELHGWLCGNIEASYVGSPQEIVDEVIRNTDRFADCDEGSVAHLRRCMVMAIRHKGHRLGLMVEKIDPFSSVPLIKVWVSA